MLTKAIALYFGGYVQALCGQRGSAGAEPGLAQGLRRQEVPEAPLAQATRARQADFVRVRAELLTDVLGHRAA
ncbi:hypothetical protein ON010_g9112 [Phytophthora cinnamomi]|nr:hypothetical protein ON010_g9112 [Phytophthora cinnamomi]